MKDTQKRPSASLRLHALHAFHAFLGDQVGAVYRTVWQREDVRFIAHAILVLAACVLVRPLFAAPVPDNALHDVAVYWHLLNQDVRGLLGAARSQRVFVPRLAFVFIPTVAHLLARQRIRWETWEAGRSLRWLIMVIVAALTWAGATFDYNLYLDRLHLADRALLVGLALLCWRTPLAVPFFAVLANVMMLEIKLPINHDDFDWRPLTELLILFSCFTWLSFLRSLKTKHFVFLALCWFGAYYYSAGLAKLRYGPDGSWLFDNHLSHLFVSSHLNGWLAFLSEQTVIKAASFFRRLDLVMALFTLSIAELGALIFINTHPRLTRFWLLSAALLHAGIFLMSGVCFWKWIAVDLALWNFLRRGGAEVHRQIFCSKAVLVFGVLLIANANARTYFNPQPGVAWYDTNLNELYPLYAVGVSGKKYSIHPGSMAPFDARITQAAFCYLSREKNLTGIYGTSGNHAMYKALLAAHTPDDVVAVADKHGRLCDHPELVERFDDLMQTFFKNWNREGRPHRWLSRIGRPDHIWVQRTGEQYEGQEPVQRIEVWHGRALFTGDAIIRIPPTKIHEVAIPGDSDVRGQ